MRKFVLLGLTAVAACVAPPVATQARAGGCCCNVAAPAAASPAAAAQVTPASGTVAQNQGYRSYSYQPGATMNTGGNYYRSSSYRGGQPMWMNGSNKSMGRYH